MPPRILDGDQRGQLQRLGKGDAADLPQRVLCDQEVAALDRSLEDRPRVALCGRACLSGAGREPDSKSPGRARGRAVKPHPPGAWIANRIDPDPSLGLSGQRQQLLPGGSQSRNPRAAKRSSACGQLPALGQENGVTVVHEASAKTEPLGTRPLNRRRSPAPRPARPPERTMGPRLSWCARQTVRRFESSFVPPTSRRSAITSATPSAYMTDRYRAPRRPRSAGRRAVRAVPR